MINEKKGETIKEKEDPKLHIYEEKKSKAGHERKNSSQDLPVCKKNQNKSLYQEYLPYKKRFKIFCSRDNNRKRLPETPIGELLKRPFRVRNNNLKGDQSNTGYNNENVDLNDNTGDRFFNNGKNSFDNQEKKARKLLKTSNSPKLK